MSSEIADTNNTGLLSTHAGVMTVLELLLERAGGRVEVPVAEVVAKLESSRKTWIVVEQSQATDSVTIRVAHGQNGTAKQH